MEVLLKNNVFSFNNDLYVQLVGAPMGGAPVPDYANMFMAQNTDKSMKNIANKYNKQNKQALKLHKRFLDDIYLIFCGSSKALHQFLKEINQVNPTIELTMSHTSIPGEAMEDRCDCEPLESIPFLDTLSSVKEGKIETTLFRKQTDRNQYLLPTCCHPRQTTRSIPFSLATRIIRICSSKENREQELNKLKELLLERQYKLEVIESAIEKAKKIPRDQLLKPKLQKDENKRPVFAVLYDPRLPSIQPIQAKHWRAMTSRDCRLKEVFPAPPLTAFKRQRNLRDHLIRAKIPENRNPYPQRASKGMFKCHKSWCNACPFIKEGKNIKMKNRKPWNINKKVNCNSMNIVYVIECDKCEEKYVGETKRTLRKRLAEHRGYVLNKQLDIATGAHYNSPGHSVANMKISVIEQVKQQSDLYRKEREEYFIRKIDTYHNGLNRKT